MGGLTIVIPTFNEAENLPALAAAIWALPLPAMHLLIVDDSSPDRTADVARELAAGRPGQMTVLQRSGKLGLGTAYIAGFREALRQGAEVIGQMDADFSHAPSYLPGFVTALEGTDVVYGSRYVAGEKNPRSLNPRSSKIQPASNSIPRPMTSSAMSAQRRASVMNMSFTHSGSSIMAMSALSGPTMSQTLVKPGAKFMVRK